MGRWALDRALRRLRGLFHRIRTAAMHVLVLQRADAAFPSPLPQAAITALAIHPQQYAFSCPC